MNITLFYENVTILDYAFYCPHRGVVGNAYKVNVEFVGHTDDEGILYDFSFAKKKVKEIIDRDCDHRFVVPKGLVKFEGDRAYSRFQFGLEDQEIEYWTPAEGICEIPFKNVSKESLATYLEEIVLEEMPENVDAVKINLVEENLEDHNAYFHYSHGLKDHYGNCQRLFHGHRNTVKVYVNDQRNAELEKYLAHNIFSGSIHFVYWENVSNKEELLKATSSKSLEGRFSQIPDVRLKYLSGQGEFEAKIPAKLCYFMLIETTVENLSCQFAKIIKEKVNVNDQVKVVAYEGIAKGAISTIF